ncbi:SAM-dependent methyltransferase [Mycobacterium sp. IDR2000157661]|uniref:SAM-dependent methyltransferase n=1 Tax=Mycobacterium sp. IDR2000157661 TaxID=2867005 RepID=UPI001EE9D922|nr:class I SAM-dependent methyltransferase [Mycobacterium sp. IDR2000157661]
MSTPDTKQHWEDHYSERKRVWSGRANVRLVEVASTLAPGAALDLGCGEGGDAMWLAEHGWRVVAVDISDTALARAAEDAEQRGVRDRIDFQQHDLSATFPVGEFDLVSAQFFHSMLPLDRTAIFGKAAAVVRRGGVVMIVDHCGPPPWASKLDHDHHHTFVAPEELLSSLALPEADWETARVDTVEREITDPEGRPTTWIDNVIALRRR